MANTSATELLRLCLERQPASDALLRAALDEEDGRAFFRIVVERLGDLFEPELCERYAQLFARAIQIASPELSAQALIERYGRIRQPRVCSSDPEHIFVLSRVTLGADVAVTSVLLHAAKQRFPEAAIYLVGPRKNWELFAADARILHKEFSYPRAGSFAERVCSWPDLHVPDSIVIDPDSRLSQLGLLPVCREQDHFFFESRSYGDATDATLVQLAREWARQTLQVEDAHAYVAPLPGPATADIAVSLGVGDNPEKRVPDPFEEQLLRALTATGRSILLDEGAGGEETVRVRHLARQFPEVTTWSGAYAPFAHAISKAKLYVGYDSAGQHVAAACGTPLVSVFAGYPAERMFQRWRPDGPGCIHVVKVAKPEPEAVLQAVLQNLTL